MKDKKRHQNIMEARTYFGIDLTKDYNAKYDVHRIDTDSFLLGMDAGFDVSVKEIPSEYKDNISFVEGYNRAKRILKNQIDLYNMGKEYYFKGIDIDSLPQNYKNNEYFMCGYNDAIDISLEDSKLRGHGRR